MRALAAPLLAVVASAAAPARAELFGGVMAHGVDTPFTDRIGEGGADVELGWRGARIAALHAIGAPRPHAFVSLNTAGDTDFAAAGLSWRIGAIGPVFVRPGIGVAIHDGPSRRTGRDGYRTDLGSRVLFEPEIAVGVPLSRRATIEASWVHVSHAQLFGRQNPGLDTIGVRVSTALR